jgi:hypothetical protein
MINSIDAAVIVVGKNDNIELVNEIALNFFCFNRESCPNKYFYFVQGNSNPALVQALEAYRKNGKTTDSATILSPEVKTVNLFFSLFTLKNENDATMIIMKDHFKNPPNIGKKIV